MQRNTWMRRALLGAIPWLVAPSLAAAAPAAPPTGEAWDDSHMRSRHGSVAGRPAARVVGGDRFGAIGEAPEPATGVVEQTLEAASQHPWARRGAIAGSSATSGSTGRSIQPGSFARRHRGTPGARSSAQTRGSGLRRGSVRRTTGGR